FVVHPSPLSRNSPRMNEVQTVANRRPETHSPTSVVAKNIFKNILHPFLRDFCAFLAPISGYKRCHNEKYGKKRNYRSHGERCGCAGLWLAPSNIQRRMDKER